MADSKITQLTAGTALTTDDVLPYVDNPGGTPVTKKITWANVLASIWTAITSITGKTTPVDADTFVISDSAASNVGKSVTWANIKATLAATYALIANGTANYKMFMNAAGTSAEWANGMKIGTFTYDTSTASGTQAITGVGFKPSKIIFLINVPNTSEVSIGFSDGSVNYSIYNTYAAAAGQWSVITSSVLTLLQTAVISLTGTISALGSDGFTITWTKTGSKTGTATIIYLALR